MKFEARLCGKKLLKSLLGYEGSYSYIKLESTFIHAPSKNLELIVNASKFL